MIVLDDDTRVRELLAPLNDVEPVARRAGRSSRRKMVVAAVVGVALLVAGVALAAGFNAFPGIGAANHTRTSNDVLPAAALAQLRLLNQRPSVGARERILPGSSRFVRQLASGRRIYVLTTTRSDLAVLVTYHGHLILASVGRSLSRSQPVTVAIDGADGPNGVPPPFSYGLAHDGVTAVSFQADGEEKTVPVKDNVWAYEGRSQALAAITVHYANGTSTTLRTEGVG